MSKSPQPKNIVDFEEDTEPVYRWKPEVELNEIKTGSRFNLLATVFLVLGLILLMALAGCSRQTAAPVVVPVHDTMWQQYYEVDTVFTDRWHYVDRKGDTVWMLDSVIVYRAKYVHDTTRVVETVTVPVTMTKTEYVEKQLPWYRQGFLWLGRIVFFALLAFAGYKGFRLWQGRFK